MDDDLSFEDRVQRASSRLAAEHREGLMADADAARHAEVEDEARRIQEDAERKVFETIADEIWIAIGCLRKAHAAEDVSIKWATGQMSGKMAGQVQDGAKGWRMVKNGGYWLALSDRGQIFSVLKRAGRSGLRRQRQNVEGTPIFVPAEGQAAAFWNRTVSEEAIREGLARVVARSRGAPGIRDDDWG